jgi:6,7-dimethyl-8-ribityllumazine synthase
MSEPYDHDRRARPDGLDEPSAARDTFPGDDLDAAHENVFEGWPSAEDVAGFASRRPARAEAPAATAIETGSSFAPLGRDAPPESGGEPEEEQPAEIELGLGEVRADLSGPDDDEPAALVDATASAGSELGADTDPDGDFEPPVGLVDVERVSQEHAPGDLEVPPGYGVLEGVPDGSRRAVGVVVSRFNGEITSRLLASALEELETAGVPQGSVTVMPVPGAFELPIGAMALARTRRFACIVALGCVIRGDTPHFDYVASEAASGLQLAALETGVPVAFGVLTLERADQADARVDKGADAARTALEMADLFSHLRAAVAR